MKRALAVALDGFALCLCAAALLLAAATAAAWVRSYRVADSFWWNQPNSVRAVVLSRGSLRFHRQVVGPAAPFRVLADRGHHAQPAGPGEGSLSESQLATAWQFLGFGYAAGPDAYGFRRVVAVPCWAVVAAAGLVPAWWLALRRRRRFARRRALNQCVRCGYNLTGNQSGVCPECGSAVAAAV